MTAVMLCCSFAGRSQMIIYTFAGSTGGDSGDGGPATAAHIQTPSGVATDKHGNVYISDQNSNRIRKINAAGIITTVAGDGTTGYSGDGGAATAARLQWPTGVAVDKHQNIYIADQFNNVIRRMDSLGIITTIAGDGTIGYSGDGGPAINAQFWHPADVGVDSSGNVYVADQDNQAIRKIWAATGLITTVGGNGTAGYGGDGGPATAAQLNFPQAIGVDGPGNVYVADFYNGRVRKIDISGTITTVAGNGGFGFSGDGGPATSAQCADVDGVAIDDTGNIYLVDYYNSRVRKVNAATGIISTLAGNGMGGYSGDGGPADSATLNFPQGVAVNDSGFVYIADFANARVRILKPAPIADTTTDTTLRTDDLFVEDYCIAPNPCKEIFSIKTGAEKRYRAEVYDITGNLVYQAALRGPAATIDLAAEPPGVYFLYIRSAGELRVKKLIRR